MTKEKLIENLQALPAEKFNNLEDLLEEIILLNKIETAMKAEENGETLTEEEVDKMVESW